jgi:cell division protein ZapA
MVKNATVAPPGYTTVSIYDQAYHLTGQNPAHIHRLAELVDSKMRAVAMQGRTVDSLRVAVLAALNLADELQQCSGGASRADVSSDVSANASEGHARALTLRGLLDEVLEDERKTG